MREARRRIHSLLDDTFQTLKKYQKQLGSKESESESSPPKRETNSTLNRNNSLPKRHPGKLQALPPPGTAQTPVMGTGVQIPNPYTLPQYPQYPAYGDPLITWDPMERQR